MLVLAWVYFGLFVAYTAAHLYGSLKQRSSLRGATKPVILLTLLGMYLEYMHFKGAGPSLLLVFALLCSWLGDVLLIPRGVKWFAAGGFFFWASHMLFIFTYRESGIVFGNIPAVLIVLIALVYAAAAIFLALKLKPHLPDKLFCPVFIYLLTNGVMNAFAWYRLLSGGCTALSGLATGVGALLFFASDATLFFVRFDKNSPIRSHFPVMLTYSLAELLIVLGLMLQATV